MVIKLFLKFFFSLPVWLLRCITFQKSTVINNQMLDFQTQIFLGLQSLQVGDLDDPSTFDSAQEFRDFVIEGLSLSFKPSMPIKIRPPNIPNIEDKNAVAKVAARITTKIKSNSISQYLK